MDCSENVRRYDAALLGILSNENNVHNFLDVMFGFLYRNTDFYRIKHTEFEKYGFPRGVAESISYQAFQKYRSLANKDEGDRMKRAEKDLDNEPILTDIDHEEEVSAPPTESLSDLTVTAPQDSSGVAAYRTSDLTVHKYELKASDTYNGADRGHYWWSQSIIDLDVNVKVPQHIVKGNQIQVNLCRTKLSIRLKHSTNEEEYLVNDILSWKINVEKSLWTLLPGDYIHVSLAKDEERWWDSIFVNEPKINLQKIDASRPIEELDNEAQAKVNELLFNEHQKKLGKMTSDQMRMSGVLKEAWDKEGSPFKGQPFDPSIVQIENNCSL